MRCVLGKVVLVVTMLVGPPVRADLTKRVDAILAGNAARRMKVGVHVRLLPSGKVLYSRRATELFIPASNVKIVTAASALHHLTPGFTFRTLFYANGNRREGGVLKGDLVIQGDGDPNISGRFHGGDVSYLPRTWARILHQRGFRRITGDLIADDTIFDRQYTCPSWPAAQLHKWYAAPVAGLSFNDNCLDIIISPTTNGRRVRLTLHPNTRYVTVANQLITTSNTRLARQRGFFLSRKLGTNDVILKGAWPAGAAPERKFVTVHEPPLYLATVIAEEMRRVGITLDGKVRLARRAGHFVGPKDPRVHIIHTSSLRDTLRVMNKRSQSFYAEQLLKRTGAACFGQGTFVTGVNAASAYLKGVGIPPGTYVMADGGGLSRGSRFTPEQFTHVLTHVYNAPYGKMFVDSLSRSGIDKSLKKRLATPAYRGRIAGKTGTLNAVVTLSGYAFNRHGKVLAFSILVNNSHNNWTARAFTDDICRILIDEKLP